MFVGKRIFQLSFTRNTPGIASSMGILLYLSLIVILTELTKTQSTVKYGNTVNDGSCMAQYCAMSHSLSKMYEDIEEIKKALITQSSYVKKKESQYQIF